MACVISQSLLRETARSILPSRDIGARRRADPPSTISTANERSAARFARARAGGGGGEEEEEERNFRRVVDSFCNVIRDAVLAPFLTSVAPSSAGLQDGSQEGSRISGSERQRIARTDRERESGDVRHPIDLSRLERQSGQDLGDNALSDKATRGVEIAIDTIPS